MTKLYVGRIPYSYNDQSLKDLFASYGNVSTAVVIMDRETGRSKGFGFVELDDDAAAAKAIQDLNNKDVDGQTIVVSVARPKEDRPTRSFGSGGGNGGNRDRDFRKRY